ncbi:hypothetical protein M9Y10_023647 [Tritrichomonas musculus]|uniref:Protein NO VEIN C-terminal domain-containing protein n=1 Tax=Tritrichomonas musculus TaxID=1915356 RepID=A0ABR2KYW4_9EUKA
MMSHLPNIEANENIMIKRNNKRRRNHSVSNKVKTIQMPRKAKSPNPRNNKKPSNVMISPPKEKPNNYSRNPRMRNYFQNQKEKLDFLNICRGEAYTYDTLVKSGKFTEVNWRALSNDPNDQSITVNYETYYFKKDQLKQDIIAQNAEGMIYNFEVKSTKHNDYHTRISHCQIDLAKNLIDTDEQYYVACVLNVDTHPSIIYYKKAIDIL